MTQPSTPKSAVIQAILVAAVVALGLAVWRQQGDIQRMAREKEELAGQKESLEKQLSGGAAQAPAVPEAAALQSAPAAAETQPASPAEAVTPPAEPEPAASASEDAGAAKATPSPHEPVPVLVATPTGLEPAPKVAGLTLAGTHVAPVEGGLQATLRFNPNTDQPLGVVAVVVRLPRDSNSQILDLVPSADSALSNLTRRVSPDGRFAIFNGTMAEARALEFALSVSGTAVADVRGTCGIGPYQLEITPTAANVQSAP